jgi:hypothetical protein
VNVAQPQRLGLAGPVDGERVDPALGEIEAGKITLISLALSMPSNSTTVGRRPLPAPRTK